MQVWTEESTRISVGSEPASLRRVTLQLYALLGALVCVAAVVVGVRATGSA